jgi:hypothetical protein
LGGPGGSRPLGLLRYNGVASQIRASGVSGCNRALGQAAGARAQLDFHFAAHLGHGWDRRASPRTGSAGAS